MAHCGHRLLPRPFVQMLHSAEEVFGCVVVRGIVPRNKNINRPLGLFSNDGIQRRRGLKRTRDRKSQSSDKQLQSSDRISTESFKFLTKEIMGAKSLNFAPKFPKWGFSSKFCIFDKNFPTRRRFSDNFSTAQKFRGGGNCRQASPLSRHTEGILKTLSRKLYAK